MSITEIFNTMDYGTASESDKEVRAWLAGHGKFGHFIGGKWIDGANHFASHNPATGEALAQLATGDTATVDQAISAARKAQGSWVKIGGKARARFLYALARQIQKQSRFLAVLETLDNGKPIRESRDADIPLAARHFYHHAGWAQLAENEFEGYEPHGVVGQIIPWNFPFLMLTWKIAPAIAAGNTVILKPAEFTSLTALFFAQICQDIGLPDGVVNIVTGASETGAAIVDHKGLDKIAFTGSTEVGKKIQAATAARALPLTLELGGKSPFIVFEDADLDAAVEGIVNAIWFNQGEVCCAGSRVLVQESVAEKLYTKIRARMDKLRVGNPLDKSIDIGALVDPSQQAKIKAMVDAGIAEGGEFYQSSCKIPAKGCFYPPQFIADISPTHTLASDEIFGPVLVSMRFRTESEAIALANHSRYGLAASLWSENLDQCLSVAPQIRAGVVWINSHNLFDAAAEFGGVKESGFGREGGKNGMLDYMRPVPAKSKPLALKLGAASAPSNIDTTRKFFIGGKQARPDSGYSRAITAANGAIIDHVGVGSRKDLRNAVEAMSASSWRKASAHNRAQVLYYLGENLEHRKAEFTTTLEHALGKKDAQNECEAAIDACFTFAAWADKNGGSVQSVPQRAVALSLNEAVGNIGILAANGSPFATPMRAICAALCMGNTITIIAPEDFPLPVIDIAALCESSDVPAGALNIIAGNSIELGAEMAKHSGLDAVWDFVDIGDARAFGSLNVKRISSLSVTSNDQLLLKLSTEHKTVWLPYGAIY